MPDRLEAMSVLLSVVDAGSLSAASRNLGLPLATVSRKVSELESHLTLMLPQPPKGVAAGMDANFVTGPQGPPPPKK